MWKVKVLIAQSCPTLCDPADCSPPGYSVHGIFQPRILEWVTIPFSRKSSWPRDQTWVSCIADRFFTTWATRKSATHIHILLFFGFPSYLGHYRALSRVHVLYSRFSLVICFIHSISSVYMSIPISQVIPSILSFSSQYPYVCSLYLSLFLLCIIYTSFQIPYICVNIWYLFSSLWLTSFCMTVSRSILLYWLQR